MRWMRAAIVLPGCCSLILGVVLVALRRNSRPILGASAAQLSPSLFLGVAAFSLYPPVVRSDDPDTSGSFTLAASTLLDDTPPTCDEGDTCSDDDDEEHGAAGARLNPPRYVSNPL